MHSKDRTNSILRSLGNKMRFLKLMGSSGQQHAPVNESLSIKNDVVQPLDLDFSDRDKVAFPEYCDKNLNFYKTKCKSESEIDWKMKEKHTEQYVEIEPITKLKEPCDHLVDVNEDDYFEDFVGIDDSLSCRLKFSSNPDFSRLCFDYGTPENSPKMSSKHLHCSENTEAQRNDREEIRKKLAMTAEVDEDNFNEDKPYKKSSSRVLTGKNLQICFMNEDQDQEDQPHVAIDTSTEKPQEPPKTHLDCKTNSNENSVSTERRPDEDDEDFFKRQARLQKEAKIALAQASTMAHMQLEVERQKKKASPIAEIVGIPYIGDNRRQRVGLKLMYEMNVAQLQVVVNDLHTQIENLNEELVQLLMERDELHMSQDSMLVDIEDHTRRAEETAVRLNTKQVRQHSKS